MKEIEFRGKVAVVTGAASGMGLLAAQEFARLGASVVLCDVNAAALDEVVADIVSKGGKALACAGDVRKWDDAMRAAAEADKLGGCDILVTCASWMRSADRSTSPKSRFPRPTTRRKARRCRHG